VRSPSTTTASPTTRTRPISAGWMPSGGCSNGWTARHSVVTTLARGCADTTSTTRRDNAAAPERGVLCPRWTTLT
jgi:hypothetical protein